MSEDKKDGKVSKGFAGLSSMVSDVDVPPSDDSRFTEPKPINSESPPSRVPPPQQSQPRAPTYQQPAQPPGSGTGTKWAIGIAVVVGLLWLVSLSDKKSTSTPTPYPPTTSSPATQSGPSISPPTPQVQTSTRPTEERPPVGIGNVLGAPQIRYCVAEDIRLDAAKNVISQYNDSDIDRFNALVADYNSRCSNFRYRRGALESAKSDVERYRSDIAAEGRARFSTGSVSSRSVTKAPEPPKPDRTLQAIQRRLNKFGYDAGEEDGFLGEKSRSAIAAFQRDENIPADGIPTTDLLKRLSEHVQQRPETTRADAATQAQPAARSATTAPIDTKANTGKPDLSALASSERSAIENACSYYERNEGPAAYYRCLNSEVSKLAAFGRRPDISQASSAEQLAIENACGYYKRNEGPASYYRCLSNELGKLASAGGKPDISRATPSEQAAIENACGYYKRNEGPASYYRCLGNEMAKLSSAGAKPDLSRASVAEQSSIENACGYYKRNEGPASYYRCIGNELSKLAAIGAKPDLSRASPSEQASIDNACGYQKRNEGPASYYKCLSNELGKLGYR